jgi:TRAP-type C4-dicarboxylate transport system substrate-binding protein
MTRMVGRRPLCPVMRHSTLPANTPRKRTPRANREVTVLKKLLPTFGALIAAATLVTAAPAQEIKLTLADQNSPTAWGPTHALQPWVKQIEEATKGRVKIEVFPSQTLVKGPDMWRQVRAGVVDIGWCFHGYWADQTPLADVISLPFLPTKTSEQASAVLWQLYEKFPAIQKEFSDVVPLLLYTTSPYFILTSKKQVKTMEDMKGLKIRIPGGPPTEMIKALGAVPAPVPMPDMYQALDKGVVDGMGVPWEAIQGFRLYEVAKYYTMVSTVTPYFSLCANKQKWTSLPKDIKDAIMSVSGLPGAKFWGKNFFDTAEVDALAKIKAGNYPMERYEMPAAEVARWQKTAGEPIWEEWVKKMEAKGHKEAREILNTALELLKK